MDLDKLIHIPIVRAMRLFDQTSLFRVMIQVGTYEDLETVKAQARAVIRERHDGDDDVTFFTQDSMVDALGRVITALTLALGGIAAISLTVAGVGIMNVMLVSVSERTREIGLLKAVGVTRAQVVGVFLVEASILSTTGGLLGFAAGMGIIIKRPIGNAVWRASSFTRSYTEDYFRRAGAMAELGPIEDEPDDPIVTAMGFLFAHPEVDTAIVGTKNPDHMRANISLVEEKLPIPESVVEELHRRFEQLDHDWRQRT